MATFLDATLLGYFRPVAIFLVTWVICYGALQVAQIFGEDTQGLNALIAFAAALLVIVTGPALEFLNYVLPWLAVVAVAFFFLTLGFMALGADMDWIQENMLSGSMGWIITIGIVLALFGLGNALGGNGSTGTAPSQVSTGDLSQEELQQRYEQRQNTPGGQQPVPPSQRRREGDEPLRQELRKEGNSFGARIVYTFTHPKVLGLLFLLVLGSLTIANLAASN